MTESQTYWESGYGFCSEANFNSCGGLILKAKKLDPLHTFELEQLVYLVEQHNRCTKMAVGEITKRLNIGEFPQHIDCKKVVESVDNGGISHTKCKPP